MNGECHKFIATSSRYRTSRCEWLNEMAARAGSRRRSSYVQMYIYKIRIERMQNRRVKIVRFYFVCLQSIFRRIRHFTFVIVLAFGGTLRTLLRWRASKSRCAHIAHAVFFVLLQQTKKTFCLLQSAKIRVIRSSERWNAPISITFSILSPFL